MRQLLRKIKRKGMERKRQWPISSYIGLLLIFYSSAIGYIQSWKMTKSFSDQLKEKKLPLAF